MTPQQNVPAHGTGRWLFVTPNQNLSIIPKAAFSVFDRVGFSASTDNSCGLIFSATFNFLRLLLTFSTPFSVNPFPLLYSSPFVKKDGDFFVMSM